jgi:NTP pyrophosphatase (non-canonical NTP hydrolase)
MSTENETETEAKSFAQMQSEIREVNVANGWYDGAERPFGDDVSLLHSEVSEMYEAFRQWGLDDATVQESARGTGQPPKPEGVGSEAADVLIRLLDTCDRHGIDLGAEYERKLAHNRTRGYRHGGKRV